ncbi:hypothetical protein [Kineosporia babensis]|uniref:Uncharacterized protein n=1 Tax=Kineosporia babensis TaxID=499548 RepID=A0A9X1NAS4_9ACTN|nr:hypothetical protein [Kineosporia babensis]MCD5310275.1 hypothetical protein [Kineosporia babensis]
MSAAEIWTLTTEAGTQHTVRVKRHLIGYSVIWERDGTEVLDSWDVDEVGVFGDEKSGVLRVQVPSADELVQEVALYPSAGAELKALKEQVLKSEPGGGLQFGAVEFRLDGDDRDDEAFMDEYPRAYIALKTGYEFVGWTATLLIGLMLGGVISTDWLPDLPDLPRPDVSVNISNPISLPDLPFGLPDLPSLAAWLAPVACVLFATVMAGLELSRARRNVTHRRAALRRTQPRNQPQDRPQDQPQDLTA